MHKWLLRTRLGLSLFLNKLSHQYLLDASTRVELITLLSISCEGIMIAGVNIDVAVVQLVELEIVILVAMGSTPIGHLCLQSERNDV